jgi:hypothetical protein
VTSNEKNRYSLNLIGKLSIKVQPDAASLYLITGNKFGLGNGQDFHYIPLQNANALYYVFKGSIFMSKCFNLRSHITFVYLCSLFFSFNSLADDDGTWTYNLSGANATVTGCVATCPGDLILPQTIDGYIVTIIGERAFFNNQLTSVTIPDSVINIRQSAFSFNQLTSVTIPETVTSIGNDAFSYNLLTSVTIPNSVTIIRSNAFYRNQLTSVTIPASVVRIEASAFGDNQLTSVAIPDSVISLSGFSGNLLTSVIIGNNVTSIGGEAFFSNQLTSVTIPDSVIVIGLGAFSQNQLTSVIIGNNVTSIGGEAFFSNQLTSVTIPESVTIIRERAFADNNLTIIQFLGNRPAIIDTAISNNSLNMITYCSDTSGWPGVPIEGITPINDCDNDGVLDVEDTCPINSSLNSNGTTEGDIESFQYCISDDAPPKMHFEVALSDNFSNAETIQILYWLEGNEQHWITLTRDPETGFFITEIELNEYAASGSYNLRAMRLTDNQNNEVYLNESQINLLGFNTSVGFYNPVSDSEKPYVTSLTTLGWSINNNGEPEISFTVFVGDDLSGVKDTTLLELNSPTGTSIQKYGTKVDENTYSFDFVLNQYASSGIYPVNTIRLYDNAGNSNLSQDWIADNLEGYELTNPNSDNVASSLSYISLEAKFDEQSDRPILAVNGLATDDFSGVENVYLRLTRPSNGILDKWQEMDNGDNVLSRTFSSQIALPQIYESGEYKVDYVRTNDFAANEKTLSKADIDEANQSSITTINLYYPDDEVSDSYEIEGSTRDDFVFGANRSNDHLIGLSGNDYIFAGDGDDHVEAGEGDDLVIGGSGHGDDTYEGDEGFDTLRYTSAEQPIIVDFINGTASGINIDSDTFTGFERLIAGQSNDVIITDENINVILGYDGDDIIVASAGEDELTGGNGKDEFVFRDLALATLASYTTMIDYQPEDSVVIVNHDSASNLVWNTNLNNTVTTISVENELYFTTDGTDGYLIVTGDINAKENSFVVKLSNINSLGDISILSKSSNDLDEDGQYNYFDTDDDNDGVADSEDAFPFDADESVDTDGDGIGNNADTDDDNDGIPDEADVYPLVAIGDLLDTDNDGAPNDCDESCIALGMAADTDDDNDGVLDVDDAYPLNSNLSSVVKNDTNGDGKSDILFRNTDDGRNWLWTMSGLAIERSAGINVVADSAWGIAGRGDFDGDGKSDILWRNSNTGRNYIYLMNGFAIKQQGQLNYVTDTDWRIKEVADFNGDGKDDILWQHARRGDTWIYLMDGFTPITSQASLRVADLNWEIMASGDVNGDDKDDVIWRHRVRGDNYIWLMDGNTITSRYVLNSVNTNWDIAGAGDINGDGTDDIVWRNQSDGRNWAYLMNNGQIQTSSPINSVTNTNWQIADILDLNGDGSADLFWRQGQSGQSYIFLMNGLSISSQGYSNTVGTTWQVLH